ncbi:MAG: hypothetical protein LBK61_09845 [Spirochaetaceae bacterium]|jgi:hypothetical protein|nr:hypothetical protein [Spirochaetaceae bacterium]
MVSCADSPESTPDAQNMPPVISVAIYGAICGTFNEDGGTVCDAVVKQ